MSGLAAKVDFDPDELREKYRIEREKRLRADGSAQYRAPSGELSSYVEDPYTPLIEREPVTNDMEAVIVGGGFGGLLTAARMRAAGLKDIRVIEQGGDFGGTWYWNRYPGAACDTDSYIYLPLLEEVGYIPTEKYAKGPEIFEHSKRVARHYDLYANALLHTLVTDLRWSDEDSLWIVSTNCGDVFRAKYVAVTAGQMMKPKLPGVPGIEDYKGHSFHTTRWDYDYTGGDSTGGMTGLADKRVGIIGTGATSIQAIPHLGASAGELFVFQRTPSAVNVRANKLTDPEWAASLKPGWQRERMENFSTFVAGGNAETDLVNDGWTSIYRSRTLAGGVLDETADFEKMEEVRARVDSIVEDPDVAEALKPYYRALCKRPTFHDEYLATYNRPNVKLVDTNGQGIEKVTERGIVAGGVEYELDCIIFASGFQIGGPLSQRVGAEIRGRNGQLLSDVWKDGISTMFGMQTANFPNLFIVAANQVGVSSNQGHVLDVQSRHIGFIVSEATRRDAVEVDVTVEAQDEWVAEVINGARSNADFLKSCTPGYYNNEGQPNIPVAQRNGPYAPGIMAFDQILDEWRANPTLPGLVFGGQR